MSELLRKYFIPQLILTFPYKPDKNIAHWDKQHFYIKRPHLICLFYDNIFLKFILLIVYLFFMFMFLSCFTIYETSIFYKLLHYPQKYIVNFNNNVSGNYKWI